MENEVQVQQIHRFIEGQGQQEHQEHDDINGHRHFYAPKPSNYQTTSTIPAPFIIMAVYIKCSLSFIAQTADQ